jgi:hypothetical protein
MLRPYKGKSKEATAKRQQQRGKSQANGNRRSLIPRENSATHFWTRIFSEAELWLWIFSSKRSAKSAAHFAV